MTWHLGADHAGLALKNHLAEHLRAEGERVVDHGTRGPERVDYPKFARAVAEAVVAEPGARGLLVCGSGVGVCVGANRVPGVRAVLAGLEAHAALGRAHNDANVLCLGERLTGPALAERILAAFRQTPFEGGRHARRVAQLDAAPEQSDVDAPQSR